MTTTPPRDFPHHGAILASVDTYRTQVAPPEVAPPGGPGGRDIPFSTVVSVSFGIMYIIASQVAPRYFRMPLVNFKASRGFPTVIVDAIDTVTAMSGSDLMDNHIKVPTSTCSSRSRFGYSSSCSSGWVSPHWVVGESSVQCLSSFLDARVLMQ